MSVNDDHQEICARLSSFNLDTLLFHHRRFRTLLRRVTTVADLVKANVSETNNTVIHHTVGLFYTTIEEIIDFAQIFITKTPLLASRVIKYGSDEEQFIKWNERIQHCVEELGLGELVKNGVLVDEKEDLQDYENDVESLRSGLADILRLVYDGDRMNRMLNTLGSLLTDQAKMRLSYKTKTAPNDVLEIDPARVKYDKVIGHGGIKTSIT
jgi:hypothetical protein